MDWMLNSGQIARPTPAIPQLLATSMEEMEMYNSIHAIRWDEVLTIAIINRTCDNLEKKIQGKS